MSLLRYARQDWAIDVGWMSIAEDYTVLVSDELPDNDSYLYIRSASGQANRLPGNASLKPHNAFLAEHRRLHHFNPQSID